MGLLALALSWTIIGGIVLGLLALIFGLLGRGRAKRGEATNGGLSVTGIVLGIIGLLIAIGIVVCRGRLRLASLRFDRWAQQG